jgi:hypothetical protein
MNINGDGCELFKVMDNGNRIAIGHGEKKEIACVIFKTIAQALNQEIEYAVKKKKIIKEIHVYVNKEVLYEADDGRIYVKTDIPVVSCNVITDVL